MKVPACEECGDNETESMDWSDLPLLERLWLWLSMSIASTQLRHRIESGRFDDVEHYREVKQKMRRSR